MYKKLLTLQILQAISVASKKHSKGAQGTCLRDQKNRPPSLSSFLTVAN